MAYSAQREGVNPLRPYYIPPSIGDGPDLATNSTSAADAGGYTNKARDLFGDLDYKGYIADPSPSMIQSAKDVVDDLLWRYTSVLLAQPFEVAKLLLQVRSQDDIAATAEATEKEAEKKQDRQLDYASSLQHNPFADYDSDPDEPSYFGSFTPNTASPSYPSTSIRKPPTPPPAVSPQSRGTTSSLPAYRLTLKKPDSIVEIISQLWQREGAWGVWKGTNASFLYTVLQSLLENWSRSLLSALFNVPDLGLKDDMDRLIDLASPYPWASLFVAAAAAIATGLILSPLDMVRTRLIVTPTSRSPRRALSMLRSLPSYLCAPALLVPTLLHSLIHPFLTLSTPLVLRTRFMIDSDASPVTFSVAKFCSSSLALFVKLPIETVLRRGQALVMSTPEYALAGIEPSPSSGLLMVTPADSVVPLGVYNGVFGTMHHIVNEEGSSVDEVARAKALSRRGKSRVAENVYRRGQGMRGLWRGWKVSWWGLVGLWTAAAVGGGGDGKF